MSGVAEDCEGTGQVAADGLCGHENETHNGRQNELLAGPASLDLLVFKMLRVLQGAPMLEDGVLVLDLALDYCVGSRLGEQTDRVFICYSGHFEFYCLMALMRVWVIP